MARLDTLAPDWPRSLVTGGEALPADPGTLVRPLARRSRGRRRPGPTETVISATAHTVTASPPAG